MPDFIADDASATQQGLDQIQEDKRRATVSACGECWSRGWVLSQCCI